MSEHLLDSSADHDVASRLRRDGFCVEPVATDGATVLWLHGELDMAAAPLLAHAVSAAFDSRPSAMTLDLRDLSFVDSTGIGVFVSGSRRAAPIRCSFALRSPRPAVLRTLRLTGVDRLIVITDLVR